MGIYLGNKKIADLYKGEYIEQASEQYMGIIQIASWNEVDKGINDNKTITPQKLKRKITNELNDFIEVENMDDVELVEKSDLDGISNQLREEISRKQDSISDLADIRSGAAAGKTALQPVSGKGLSTNDYTNAAKAKVDAIPSNPKYTDTVYDDTALKEDIAGLDDRVTELEEGGTGGGVSKAYVDAANSRLSESVMEISSKKIDKPTIADNNKFPRTKNGDVEWVETPFVTPEMFGAKGDGIADDSEALYLAFSSGFPVILSGIYSNRKKMTISNLKLFGNGKGEIHNDGQDITHEFILTFTGRCVLDGVKFVQNIGVDTMGNVSGNICIRNTKNAIIHGCTFICDGHRCNGLLDIYTANENLTMSDCYVYCNTTVDGTVYAGGFWVRDIENGGKSKNLTFTNVIVQSKSVDEAMTPWSRDDGTSSLENIQFNNCIFESLDGAANAYVVSTQRVKNCVFTGCSFIRRKTTHNIAMISEKTNLPNENREYLPVYNSCKFISEVETNSLSYPENKTNVLNGCLIITEGCSLGGVFLKNCKIYTKNIKSGYNVHMNACDVTAERISDTMALNSICLENTMLKIDNGEKYIMQYLEGTGSFEIYNSVIDAPLSLLSWISSNGSPIVRIFSSRINCKSGTITGVNNAESFICDNIFDKAISISSKIPSNGNWNIIIPSTTEGTDNNEEIQPPGGDNTGGNDSGTGGTTYTDAQKFDAILAQAKQDITSYSYTESSLSSGLQSKTGNCAVLTEYVQIACDYLGIPCDIVYGTDNVSSISNVHMVNRVTLDGKKYWSDLSGTLTGSSYGSMLEKQSSGTPYAFQNNQGNNCYVLYPIDGTYKQLPSCSLTAIPTTVTTICNGAQQTATIMKNSYDSCYNIIANKLAQYK